jgi:hypothetical protein
MPIPPSAFDLGDGAASPLWRERAFGFTLVCFGLAAAALPVAVSGAPGVWPLATLVLLVLLAIAYLGAAAPAAGAGPGALRSLRFAIGAAALPMLAGLLADAIGMGPGGGVALLLLGGGALLALAAIAPLEVAPPPEEESARTSRGRAILAAAALFSFATAPFAQPLVDGVARRVASEPPAALWLVAALFVALLCGGLVAGAGLAGGALVRRLRYRSFRAPRAAAAALLLATSAGIAAAALTWY